MRRQHPFLSPSGIVLTSVLTVILALLLWTTGGQMFSPGPLSAKAEEGEIRNGVASHVEITDCSTCHQPLDTQQATLCLDCHIEIQTQLDTSVGLHAQISSDIPCFSCHSDHQGEDFDPVAGGLENFDHSSTGFSLIWHQVDYNATPLQCGSCHTADDFSVNEQACTDCHAAHDPVFMTEHQESHGSTCLTCHDGVDRMADFDHSQTEFPLEGQHAITNCAGCHTDNQFTDLPTQCVACHTEPPIHAGLFDTQCNACHTPVGWLPATLGSAEFDHNNGTRFSLIQHKTDFAGDILNCGTCHQTDLQTVDTNVCTTCHAQADVVFMTAHEQQFGSDCLACHDGVDRMHDFNHNDFFVLDGQHAEIECESCHVNQQFAGTPSECVACHQEPAIHTGVFGLECQNCHSTTAWTPASLKFHTFPLDHGDEGMIACATCHPTSYVQYTCNTCHEPAEMQEEHEKEDIFDISDCAGCHPTGLEEE